MTILGVLFVTGVAFMASMNFEAEMIRAERERGDTRPSVENALGDLDTVLTDGLIADDGQPGGAMLPSLSAAQLVEIPGLFNLLSPIEPVEIPDPSTPNPFDHLLVFPWFTDLEALGGNQTDYLGLRVDTAWVSGVDPHEYIVGENLYNLPDHDFAVDYPNLTPVDADGDGVVDSMQVDMALLGFDGGQLAKLAKIVNPESNPQGKVYLALRVVPHGGMVNLAESHPSLIRNLITFQPDDWEIPQLSASIDYVPYAPLVEEASLRRRFLLPPRELPPTQIQGNPLNAGVDSGEGHYAWLLFPPGESLREHRYWPYAMDNTDNNIDTDWPDWKVRMDPTQESSNPNLNHYDRRHLTTSISHDDQLRRATPVVRQDNAGNVEEFDDVLVLMREANRSACNAGHELPFPYADYPADVPNTYVGEINPPNQNVVFDVYDYCACAEDGNCRFNPRKGHLRLSLAWLDEEYDINNDPNDKEAAIQLIQNVFTMMLLNGRGSYWGEFEDHDGDPDTRRVWVYDFGKIERTAAALTANLIDFADSDGEPTRVELRAVDFNDMSTFGQPVGEFVYGLERQPFITELAASVTNIGGDPDPANSAYAVELLNPYPDELSGFDYRLEVNGIPLELSKDLAGERFTAFKNDPSNLLSETGYPGDIYTLNGLTFEGGTYVRLLRRVQYPEPVGQVDIVVDQFKVESDLVDVPEGEGANSGIRSIERQGVSGTHFANDWLWIAPMPTLSSILDDDSLGSYNQTDGDPDLKPIELLFADAEVPWGSGALQEAFPTTGALLLLMRHANSETRPFNTDLEQGYFPIDNGRMPVFDSDPAHREDPQYDSTINPDLENETVNKSGESMHLPWGQFVFDYFTALPLENDGPWGNQRPRQPRVDLDGLRVHGRINLNAAPWSVLAGLPFIPMENVPEAFRQTFRETLGLSAGDDDKAMNIGRELAQAIVAYREQRGVTWSDPVSGNDIYSGDYATQRGWAISDPVARRGMGFLTIGELANIRHPDASGLQSRCDSEELDDRHGSYLRAIAVLASMNDWVTVRSQVFTIYGTIRGDMDDTIEDENKDPDELELIRAKDVDSRALRFQETVDRLPTFIGAAAPERIGNCVLTNYVDLRND